MDERQKKFFLNLSKDRKEIADILDRRAVRGYKDSVIEKYSDQAHFVYELLQNADDVCATKARFKLDNDKLIFAHNGTRHFSISNPLNEDVDSDNNMLGDINAITSIANSNKTGASIGKFGVGFKAVFQYTSTPYIYDPEFKFKIERFIVPVMLDTDFPERNPEETLFVFPFDHDEKDKDEAYIDIAAKLKNLSYPLLFLSNLQDIQFEFGDNRGEYTKSIEDTILFDDTVAERILLTQTVGNVIYDDRLWLFSRKDNESRIYSVGFFLDTEGRLRPVNEPIFCFFPTKEISNLKFIVHAPFLLTDSREGIRAGVKHNDEMIKRLAVLAADSLEYLRDIGIDDSIRLIDDNIVDIIPFDKGDFSNPIEKHRVSFLPFYECIKDKFQSEQLLPTVDGYVKSDDAYWADSPQLTQLFSNQQLGDIVDNKGAGWAFVSLGRIEIQRNNKALFNYIDSLVKTSLGEDVIIKGRSRDFYFDKVTYAKHILERVKGISESFIEKQDIVWLSRFYKWISETKHRSEIILDKPIFLDQDGNAAPAFDKEKQLILFLPVKDIDGYRTVNPKLIENDEIYAFVKQIGIKQPSLKDQIYNFILPQYDKPDGIDIDSHFLVFFDYYKKCPTDESDEFIDMVKSYAFLRCGSGINDIGVASEMYFPKENLIRYFSAKPSTKFIDIALYRSMVGTSQERSLLNFLTSLGVKSSPAVYTEKQESVRKKSVERFIDGLQDIICGIADSKDTALSAFLWKQLCFMIAEGKLNDDILNKDVSVRRDRRYKFKADSYDSSTKYLLRMKAWLVDKQWNFKTGLEIRKNSMSDIYDLNIDGAEKLLLILGIRDDDHLNSSGESGDDSNLTKAQREKIEFADRLRSLGINEDDLDDLKEFKRRRDAKKRLAEKNEPNVDDRAELLTDAEQDLISSFDENSNDVKNKKKNNQAKMGVIKDIVNISRERHALKDAESKNDDLMIDPDEDEYMLAPVDYGRKIEEAKKKSATEIDRITYFEELHNRAMSFIKYSYGWFMTLLEMESINRNEAKNGSREVSISFAKVEREANTERTLILKHPNRYIPQFMEDLADIPLVLHIEDKTKKVIVEAANIRSYTLRVKIKKTDSIDDIDLSTVTSAEINAKSPSFLLEELRKQFNELEYEDDFNLQENLCENIEFVFGPPGTGKTTYLARNVIHPLMRDNEECKVLVLTPTNKAADVLVKRIMDVAEGETAYKDWLIRFGATGDETIEDSNIFKDKTFDIRSLSKNVTVTTIARFPYDFFMPQGERIFLNGINWDYIVVDEASMIPIANIMLPLYKKTPKKFIVAGDPFQIEPITSVDIWKNENIYTMVNLDSFQDSKTTPYQYKVELLTTQYRSVPVIGDIFSKFAYDGILKHSRKTESRKNLNIQDELDLDTLNIIKFPVSKYESIYKCKRLNHSSSYQVYSALFTFEYVRYLANIIAKNNSGELFKIGIIAPYRAQADMIDKLFAQEKIPNEIDVQVGTIHGFQGDECDIIFAIFNTPPFISASKDMFLNNKNIINVSISRARDYLFIVMPDDETENIENLRLVNSIERIAKESDSWSEYNTQELELKMFGEQYFLENNVFSTSHQSVNVYGLPERIYEVRTEDTAVDLQIHKNVSDEYLE